MLQRVTIFHMEREAPKNEFIQARVTEDEKRRIKEFCKIHRLSIAEILLEAVRSGR